MREILFRGKRKDNGEWVYGNFAKRDNVKKWEYFIGQNSLGYEVIPETVGQYTGLTDKNGKRIFEGDIVKDHTLPIKCGIGVIMFGNYETKMCSSVIGDNYSKHIGFYIKWDDTLDFRKDLAFWDKRIEVIGNIHDNPELLEVSE